LALFDGLSTAYLVLNTDLVIVEANEAYLHLLQRTRQELVGRPVFQAFPPEPASLDAQGRNPLQRSFERVRDTGLTDRMPLLQYDVPDPGTGQVRQRFWSLIHSAVLAWTADRRWCCNESRTSPTSRASANASAAGAWTGVGEPSVSRPTWTRGLKSCGRR
jgi:PAS domain-containing protein